VTSQRYPDSLDAIAQFWEDSGSKHFPLLAAVAKDWSNPFCFRCGWHAPQPDEPSLRPWTRANGWLERAHLHDRSGGGPNTADNLVPLCGLCHRYMPEFPDSREPAIEWARSQEHSGCPRWWQRKTDELFGGSRFIRNPGSTHLAGTFVRTVLRQERFDEAFRAAESGDKAGAMRLLRLLGVDEQGAEITVAAFLPKAQVGVAA